MNQLSGEQDFDPFEWLVIEIGKSDAHRITSEGIAQFENHQVVAGF